MTSFARIVLKKYDRRKIGEKNKTLKMFGAVQGYFVLAQFCN